jgi:hypothetical protein
LTRESRKSAKLRCVFLRNGPIYDNFLPIVATFPFNVQTVANHSNRVNPSNLAQPSPDWNRPKRWHDSFFIDFIGVFTFFFLYAACPVPEVNEVHYWTKAAHFWDPSFAAGDLFLESGDAHWAFYFFFGSLTLWFPIETSVWVGRFVTWISLSIAWTALCRGILSAWNSGSGVVLLAKASQAIPATVLAGLWLAGMEWGLWAGEWVVGGCESKGIAYAFLFGGLAALSRSKPTLGWLLIGLGCWFHVISGLWVGATALVSIFVIEVFWERQSIPQWLRCHFAGLFLCGIGFLAGAIPAVLMDLDAPRDQATLSAMEQVYNRLGHHLSPIKFSEVRWRGFAILVIFTFSLLLVSRNARWKVAGRPDGYWLDNPTDPPASIAARYIPNWLAAGPKPFRFIVMVCVVAFFTSMVGLLLDVILSNLAPKFASSILRFYWFRWNDVSLPLLAALLTYVIVLGELRLEADSEEMTRSVLATFGLVLVVLLLITRYQRNTEPDIPAGEKQSFSLKTDSLETRLSQYADWIAVCEWINENIEEQGLWLTPRRQQSFKWRVRQPELAVWKDMPQNARAVVEWSSRLNDAYKFDKRKQLLPWSEEDLVRLVNKYKIRYVLLDLRVAGQTIPEGTRIYPNFPETNDSFAVLKYNPPASELSP